MAQNKTEIIKNDFIGESVTKILHKSGLTVFLSKKDFTSAYAIFGTRYGSFDNEFVLDGESVSVPHGIAHFLEHKMFETEDGGDTFEQFSELGADANAYTSTDRTAYLFSCTEDFYACLEVLIKMVITPVFTDKNVLKEQGIIGQEIKMCEDRTSNILHYNLMRGLYEKNPVRIPIAGTVESISRITPELLYKCYNAFYRMNNMALCICADAEADKIIEILDKYLPERSEESVTFDECEDGDSVFKDTVCAKAEVAKPLFEIGIKIPKSVIKSAEAMDVLCEAVFGMSEDFYNDCFEREMFNSYHYYSESSRVCDYFEVGGNSDNPDAVYAELKKYLIGIAEGGISAQAFERAKRKLYSEAMRSFNGSESIAEELFEAFLVNDDFLTLAEKYGAVTNDEVNALARDIFKDGRFSMSVLYPTDADVEVDDEK